MIFDIVCEVVRGFIDPMSPNNFYLIIICIFELILSLTSILENKKFINHLDSIVTTACWYLIIKVNHSP